MKRELERFVQLRLVSPCKDYLLIFTLITQNDFIEHNNKINPISPNYQRHQIISHNKPVNLEFNHNFIKYETDDGYIFFK